MGNYNRQLKRQASAHRGSEAPQFRDVSLVPTTYPSVESLVSLIRNCLQALIASHIMQKNALDILQQKSTLRFTPVQFSHPVNFQQNPDLPELAMKQRRSKVLKAMPLRDFCSFLEAFLFGRP
jgi:hypothetical protein